jgi:hypothetical protein
MKRGPVSDFVVAIELRWIELQQIKVHGALLETRLPTALIYVLFEGLGITP